MFSLIIAITQIIYIYRLMRVKTALPESQTMCRIARVMISPIIGSARG